MSRADIQVYGRAGGKYEVWINGQPTEIADLKFTSIPVYDLADEISPSLFRALPIQYRNTVTFTLPVDQITYINEESYEQHHREDDHDQADAPRRAARGGQG